MVYGWLDCPAENDITREIFKNENILSKALTGVDFETGNSLQRTLNDCNICKNCTLKSPEIREHMSPKH